MQLKELDINATSFMANGKEYFIESKLSFDRHYYYTMLQIEFGFGVSYNDMIAAWQEVINEANSLRFSNIVIKANNILECAKRPVKKEHPALMLCALFINTENEDRRSITEDQIKVKINDWHKEGYDIVPFFTLARILLNALHKDYDALMKEPESAPISPV